jgi:hypothetical protein
MERKRRRMTEVAIGMGLAVVEEAGREKWKRAITTGI